MEKRRRERAPCSDVYWLSRWGQWPKKGLRFIHLVKPEVSEKNRDALESPQRVPSGTKVVNLVSRESRRMEAETGVGEGWGGQAPGRRAACLGGGGAFSAHGSSCPLTTVLPCRLQT